MLCVLLLRGPQTLGERGYAERLARQPGQKEERFRQLLGGGGPEAGEPGAGGPVPVAGPVAAGGFDEPVPGAVEHRDGLEERVAALEAEVAQLRAQLAELFD